MTELMEVRLAGRWIGTLSLLASERSFFSFTDSYLDDPQRPPVLSQSFFSRSGEVMPETRSED